MRSPNGHHVVFDCHTCSEAAPDSTLNEDYAAADPAAGVFVIADGMGGRPAGNLASQIAANAFLESILAHLEEARVRPAALTQAVAQANAAVRECANSTVSRKGMGTTLSAAVLKGRTGWVVHLGDSRIYLFSNGRLHRLTQDHTLVQELVRRKCLKGEDAERHPLRHVLLRTIGTQPEVLPDIHKFSFQPGDGLILTTDEMARILPTDELEEITRKNWSRGARKTCEQLVGKARKKHPQDDLTVMVTKCLANGAVSP